MNVQIPFTDIFLVEMSHKGFADWDARTGNHVILDSDIIQINIFHLIAGFNCQSALKIDPPSASKIDPPQAVVFTYLPSF